MHAGLVVTVSLQVLHASLLLQVSVIPQQLVHAAGEGEQNQEVEECELHDVYDHPAEGHLQWPQVGIH